MKRPAKLALGALLALVAPAVPAFAQADAPEEPPVEFTAEPWSGSAVYSQPDGNFSHCLMAAQFDRQMSLVVALDRAGGVSLGIRNPRWSLTLLETQPMGFTFGSGAPIEATATAVDPTLLLVRFEDGAAILADLAQAPTVSVTQEIQSFQFVMVNTAAAVEALKDCDVEGRLDIPIAAPPAAVASATGEAEAAGADEDARTILVDPIALDQTVARNFLQAAGLTDFALMTPSELDSFLGDARAAWTDGEVTGALYTVAPRQPRLQQASDRLLRVLADGCEGTFTSSPIVEAEDDGTILRRSAICDENPVAMLFRTSVINGESGTLIILHAALREAADRLAGADDMLIDAIRQGQIAVE